MKAAALLLLAVSAFPCEQDNLFNLSDLSNWRVTRAGVFSVENRADSSRTAYPPAIESKSARETLGTAQARLARTNQTAHGTR